MKKIISITTVMMLLFSSLNAYDLQNLVTSYKTTAGSWTSPSTGMKYHYGGAYEFKFKGVTNTQPWVTTGKPELKIGCNGVSLKGGFVGLLGLNEIKDQIRDAGASLAWGALMALQYATPALFGIFDTIKEWATAIQKLIQNACQIGTMLVQSTKVGQQVARDFHSFTQNLGPVGDYLEDFNKGSDELLKKVDNFVNCSNLSTAIDPATGQSPAGKCASELMDNTKKNSKDDNVKKLSLTASAGIVNFAYTPPTVAPNSLSVSDLNDFLGSGKINNRNIVSGQKLTDAANTIKMLRLFFGDIVMSKDTYKNYIIRNLENENSTDAFKKGEYKVDTAKAKERIKKILAGNADEIPKPNFEYLEPIIPNANAAHALINGITNAANSSNCSNTGVCIITNSPIYLLDFEDGSKNRTTGIGLVSGSMSGNSNLQVQWEGAVAESLKSIRALVKSRSSKPSTITTIFDRTPNTDANTLSTTIPLVIPNIQRYIKIIAEFELKEGAETPVSSHFKEVLAQMNAINIGNSMIDLIYGRIVAMKAIGGDIESISSYQENLEKIRANIKKEIESIRKDSVNFREINDMFTTIEQQMRNERAKNF